MEDRQLIYEFVTQNSERAFRDLVDRYINLVHSIAFREVRDSQLAEEVSQAVFILLARKARSFTDKTVVSGWLYRTTRFVAARALRAELRRRKHEQEAFQMQQNASSDETWRSLEPAIDEGMGQLPTKDRDAVLLRYFQEEPLRAVGDKLGISEEAARKRVDRSLEKLRKFFSRRGIKVTTGAIAAALGSHSVVAAPPALAGSIASGTLAGTCGGTLVPLLVRETLSAWRIMRTATVGMTIAAVVGCLFLAQTFVRAPQRSTRQAAETAASGTSPAPVAARVVTAAAVEVPDAENARLTFTFRAVDSQTERGLAGARVLAVVIQDRQNIQTLTNLVTDAEGRCAVPLFSSNLMAIIVGAMPEGYEQRCAFLGARGPVPSEYTLKLPRGSIIGGVVQDEAGNPIANAAITVQFYGTGDSSAREFQQERPGFPADDIVSAYTDNSGKWRFASAPETNGSFWIEVTAPGMPMARFRNDADLHGIAADSPPLRLEDLHSGNAVLVLKSGFSVGGIVTDEHNVPVANARVSYGRTFASGPTTLTKADGSFVLPGLAEGRGDLTIIAGTFAPERIGIVISAQTAPVAVRLKPGAWLRLRVIDESSNAVANADVRLQAWRGNNTIEWGGFTDEDGRIEWSSAPQDEMDIFVGKQGFFYSRKNLITADGEEHTIRLHPKLVLSGFVADAESQHPIASFKVIPGSAPNNWDRHSLAEGTNGIYTLSLEEYTQPLQVRFEAEGYEPVVSPPLNASKRQLVYDVTLQKPDPGNRVQGTVLLPDGMPARAVSVALCTAEKGVTLGRATFMFGNESLVVQADAQGRFAFPPCSNPRRVVAVNKQGFAMVDLNQTNRTVSLQLQAWGRIEGHLTLRNRSSSGQTMVLMAPQWDPTRAVGFDLGSFSAKTDEHGNFIFDQVPPGEATLYRNPGLELPFSHQTPVEVQPGTTLHVQVGGTGTSVRGRFVTSAAGNIDWVQQMRQASLGTRLPPPPVPSGLSPEQRIKWVHEFWQSDEGRAQAKASRSFPVNVESDGSFTIDDVPPGTYVLHAMLGQPGPGEDGLRNGPFIGSVQKNVEIPSNGEQTAADVFDLGSVPVVMNRR